MDGETFSDFESVPWRLSNTLFNCCTDAFCKEAFIEAEKPPIKETKEDVSVICLGGMSLQIKVSSITTLCVYNSWNSDREKMFFVLLKVPKWQISIANRFST